MAHPFFDSLSYPFDRPDAKDFLQTVGIKYSTVALIRTIFLRTGSQNWNSVRADQAPNLVWVEVVQLLCTDGLFKKLCGEIMDDLNENSGLRAAIQAIIDATDIGVSVLHNKSKLLLSDKLFMLDRESVRQKLALLSDNTAREKILIIRGAKKSGKSHLKFLVEEQAKQVGASFLYLAAGKVNTVDETIERLFGFFEEPSPKSTDSNTTSPAWFKSVSLKLKAIAANRKQPLWVAMDSLGIDEKGDPILPAEVRLFFDQFALNMDSEDFHRWFRLILIDYPDPVPIEWMEEVWTNPDAPLQEADIQAQHVAACLRDWALSQNRTIPPDDLINRSNGLINTIDAQQPQFGQELAPRLRRIHDELKRTIGELKAQLVA